MTAARLIDATPVADDWRLIRIEWHAPAPAPGQWLWIETDNGRFCLPVRDADTGEGWLAGILPAALLPPRLGPGTPITRSALQGEAVDPPPRAPLIILGEDLGIGPALALAERQADRVRLVLLGGHHGMPARLVPSRFYIPALADHAIAGLGSLENLGVAARVALPDDDRPGVHDGRVLELLGRYLSDTPADVRETLCVVACGPWGSLGQCRAGVAASVGHLQVIQLPAGTRDSTP